MVDPDVIMSESDDSDDEGPGNSGNHRAKGASDMSQETALRVWRGKQAGVTNSQLTEMYEISLTSVKKVIKLKGKLETKTRGRPKKQTVQAHDRLRAV